MTNVEPGKPVSTTRQDDVQALKLEIMAAIPVRLKHQVPLWQGLQVPVHVPPEHLTLVE